MDNEIKLIQESLCYLTKEIQELCKVIVENQPENHYHIYNIYDYSTFLKHKDKLDPNNYFGEELDNE